jgi:DAK2 domain fusion protein YloV
MVYDNREQLTGGDFRRMIAGAYRAFVREHEYINRLNVFPVPDGDTGTNMLLTLGAVSKAVAEAPEGGIGFLSKRAADSAIMGARGNSGVILSQIFRGIARGLVAKESASSAAVGKAFQYGILYAYRAVAKPVEGTILTVAKGIAKGARRAVREQSPFADMLAEAIEAGERELARTPELLPTLKAAGVVDAGGQGLLTFLKGCLEGLGGGYTGPEADFDQALFVVKREAGGQAGVTHPYCTEFIVKHTGATVQDAKQQLALLGDSLVLAAGEQLIKVHIHTAHPGAVLEQAITWGTLHDIKIDNMTDQHQHTHWAAGAMLQQGVAVISVVSGEGLVETMRSLGAQIVSGGQTMNPPVEDFIDAVHTGSTRHYILLPNNKNIILAAGQAKKLLGDRVAVIPTTSVAQGMAALVAFDPAKDIGENVTAMTERAQAVRDGSITVAVRDCVAAGRKVPTGAIIGIIDGNIVADGGTVDGVLEELVAKLLTPSAEIVSLYYGADVSRQEAERLAATLTNKYQNVEIELYSGGQPHYCYLVSVE